MSSSRHLPIRRGRGGSFPPARGTPALLSFFLSVSSFRQFPRERFLPFVSQLESPGPRSRLGPAAPGSPTSSCSPGGPRPWFSHPKPSAHRAGIHPGERRGRNPPPLQVTPSPPQIWVCSKAQEQEGPSVFPPTYWDAASISPKCAAGVRRVGGSELGPAGGAEGAPSFPAHPPRALAAGWNSQPSS